MLKIGLTGGIGSGKSTVAKMFADLGISVIDADDIVHEMLQANSPIATAIVNHFGKACLTEKAEINRKFLRKLIFANTSERRWLEKLIHPQVFMELDKRSKKAKSSYCILVVPLLLEVDAIYASMVDRILVIDSSDESRIKRVAARDKIEPCEVKAIMNAQISRADRLIKADDIIHNDGSLENLRAQVLALHHQYLLKSM